MWRSILTTALVTCALMGNVTDGQAMTRVGGRPLVSTTSGARVHLPKRLTIMPRCFVAGQRTPARITLTHVGSNARVEFIWAPKHGVTLGPGFGPGIVHANAHGGVSFSAISPSKYGNGTVGTWVLAAEWPREAHAFIRLSFRIVARETQC
jgi:hypothetical protein